MTTIQIEGVYGISQISDADEKVRPTAEQLRAESKADRVGHFDLIAERGWTEADVSMAQRCGLLPQNGDCAGAHPILGRDGFPRGQQVVYMRSRLAERTAKLKAFAARWK